MDGSLSWRKRARTALLGLAMAAGVTACGEDLEGGAACPALCPGQSVVVFDTTFDAIALDTTVVSFPPLGADPSLPLVARGDTVDVRAIVRFDSLPKTYLKNAADSTIRAVDSAYVLFVVNDSSTSVRAPVRIEVYDVDTVAVDSLLAPVRALFRNDRLLGATTFDSAQVRDSIKVFVSNAALLGKIRDSKRLRLGFRATSARPVTVDLGSSDVGDAPVLRFDPAPADTAIKALTVLPLSKTPPNEPQLQSDFTDYSLVYNAPPLPSGAILSVGGLPSRRSYLRFDIPARIADSSTVLRATLILTQRPNRRVAAGDTGVLIPQLVRAGTEVIDLRRAASLVDPFALDSVKVAPGDSGIRLIEVAAAVRQWNSLASFQPQRAIILRSTGEGRVPFEVHFFSSEAPAALRPRLRINYALRTSFGIP